jgi:hypothetical protein
MRWSPSSEWKKKPSLNCEQFREKRVPLGSPPFAYDLLFIISLSFMTEARSTELVHFKNGIFNGTIQGQLRQGEALCLYDNGAVFVGNFKGDHPSGQSLIVLSPDTYFLGNLKKGILDGSFTVRSPRYHIYSQTILNRIQGQVVVIDNQDRRARVW